ncbi:NACHT, LRR and PYD domains-containing protein 3-like [Astyanax mexicanus]|uniref:NACHT, LRR and PYD domains-containing protein 3-like n=1 Tax=Astyanax mexicanus TaxID=7994 RepID=UPI0020CAC2E1|nr:NACHT, LRR and PYD domains-containing protein 3-like [Astyanax mexicanus]
MGIPLKFMEGNASEESLIEKEGSDSSELSCVSMKSDQSMGIPIRFSNGGSSECRDLQTVPKQSSGFQLDVIFKELEHKIVSLVKNELIKFKELLILDNPTSSETELEDEKDLGYVRHKVLKITTHILRSINQTHLANTLQTRVAPACQQKFKTRMQKKYQIINEGISKQGTSTLLNLIYTELFITEGGSGEVNSEHEVRQIEEARWKTAAEDTPIKCNDIFTPSPGQDKTIRTVLTKGIAGIGKTVSVQKFILDWAEGKTNQEVHFVFPLPFRELNLMKGKILSLMDLLCHFFIETKEMKLKVYTQYRVMFIFDGLDECRLPLDFQNNEILQDVTQSASVDVLLTNLIRGKLLPSALIWITSRPAAANQIPPECVDQVTEVRGFNDLQKQEYFRKRIRDQSMAEKICQQ